MIGLLSHYAEAAKHKNILVCSFEIFRYDYEKVDSAGADKMVERLNAFIADKTTVGKEFTAAGKSFKVAKAEDFEYVDPIDKSVAKKQVCHALLLSGLRKVNFTVGVLIIDLRP